MTVGISSTTSTISRGHSTIPAPSTSLIDQEWAVNLVGELLRQDEVHLLTLLGAAGVGKTRLSLAVATTLLNEFADEVFFVSLGDIHEAALVPSTIAQVLDLVEPIQGAFFSGVSQSYKRILKAFIGEKDMLLILDNIEQNAAIVAQLCLRLEGLPLAIELAAARSRLLSPQAILERLGKSESGSQHGQAGQSLIFLRQQARNMPARQQTLLHTLDWSYHLLDTQAQQLFTRLGVFVPTSYATS